MQCGAPFFTADFIHGNLVHLVLLPPPPALLTLLLSEKGILPSTLSQCFGKVPATPALHSPSCADLPGQRGHIHLQTSLPSSAYGGELCISECVSFCRKTRSFARACSGHRALAPWQAAPAIIWKQSVEEKDNTAVIFKETGPGFSTCQPRFL